MAPRARPTAFTAANGAREAGLFTFEAADGPTTAQEGARFLTHRAKKRRIVPTVGKVAPPAEAMEGLPKAWEPQPSEVTQAQLEATGTDDRRAPVRAPVRAPYAREPYPRGHSPAQQSKRGQGDRRGRDGRARGDMSLQEGQIGRACHSLTGPDSQRGRRDSPSRRGGAASNPRGIPSLRSAPRRFELPSESQTNEGRSSWTGLRSYEADGIRTRNHRIDSPVL